MYIAVGLHENLKKPKYVVIKLKMFHLEKC